MTAPDRRERMRSLIDLLCSKACAGRKPNTPGSAIARDRITKELVAAGVAPFGSDAPGLPGFLQTVPKCGANVVGRVPGAGALASRAIVIGAHYDHLGLVPALARSEERAGRPRPRADEPGAVDGAGRAAGSASAHRSDAQGDVQAYWGADDNAAGVSILVEVGRSLAERAKARPTESRRQVILAAFDGEEPPHFLTGTMGSMHWCRFPPLPLADIDQMVCMDLVGHALGPEGLPATVRQALFVLGAERSAGTAALVDQAAARARGVAPRRLGMDVVPPLSDYHAFEQAGVASLFLTCGRWEHYHQPSDTPDKLDLAKVEATAEFLSDLTALLATRTDGPVRHRPHQRDDLATATTLLDLGRALAPASPMAALALPKIEGLQRLAARGPLDEAGQQGLRLLVAGLEQSLS